MTTTQPTQSLDTVLDAIFLNNPQNLYDKEGIIENILNFNEQYGAYCRVNVYGLKPRPTLGDRINYPFFMLEFSEEYSPIAQCFADLLKTQGYTEQKDSQLQLDLEKSFWIKKKIKIDTIWKTEKRDEITPIDVFSTKYAQERELTNLPLLDNLDPNTLTIYYIVNNQDLTIPFLKLYLEKKQKER